MLRQSSIRDTQDLLIKTPGVFLAGSGGRENTNFSIRGQSKALAGNSAAAVLSYFAAVPSPTVGSSIPTYELGSAQVLTRPLCTLFDRNTPGGAILSHPTTPSSSLYSFDMFAFGNHEPALTPAEITLPADNAQA